VGQPGYVADYDPRWPATFERIRTPIAAALGALAVRIEHVGSTSVPGLAAKPIIDLDVVIASRADLPAVIARLGPLGYRPQGDLGIPGRESFNNPPGLPEHHLYVCVADNAELARHLAFRDYLRGHPEAVRGYASLKRSLAIRFRNDRDAYTEAKAAFIEQALASSAAEAVEQGGQYHETGPDGLLPSPSRPKEARHDR
jgi:GrpB-like predicted nucleotidyltransferase (UPF0157 family)